MRYFFLIAMIAPLTWGLINHIDRYAVLRFMKGRDPGSLILFTGLSALFMSVLVFIFAPVQHLVLRDSLRMIIAGTILVFSYIPYLYALNKDEASNVAPLFQMVTPCAYVLALVFLHEHISSLQLMSGVLILSGAFVLSFDFERARVRARSFFLMLLTSIMISINVVMFKSFAISTNFWTTVFYDLVGATVAGLLILFFIPKYRRDFFSSIREFHGEVIGINMFAETANLFARMLNGFVSLFVPIAITQFVIGLQPLFILLTGILLTKFAPHLGKENISKSALQRKFTAIILMLSGIAMLVIFS